MGGPGPKTFKSIAMQGGTHMDKTAPTAKAAPKPPVLDEVQAYKQAFPGVLEAMGEVD